MYNFVKIVQYGMRTRKPPLYTFTTRLGYYISCYVFIRKLGIILTQNEVAHIEIGKLLLTGENIEPMVHFSIKDN